MAQQVLVQMVDDIDGSEANQTVPFSLDGVEYEIDLSEENASELRDSLARYVSAAKRIGGRKVRLATGQSLSQVRTSGATDREKSKLVRAWALESGYEISERGRIPAHVVTAYEQRDVKPAAEAAPKTGRKRTAKKKVA